MAENRRRNSRYIESMAAVGCDGVERGMAACSNFNFSFTFESLLSHLNFSVAISMTYITISKCRYIDKILIIMPINIILMMNKRSLRIMFDMFKNIVFMCKTIKIINFFIFVIHYDKNFFS